MSKHRYEKDLRFQPRDGGFGRVFKVLRKGDGAVRALKLLREDWIPEHFQRFALEAQVLFEMDHPNIVIVDDYHFVRGQCFLVMEFLGGGTLRDRMTWRMLDVAKVSAIENIAAGLAYAHANGVIHRDLKPDNVLWDHRTQQFKLADFGVARLGGYSLGLTHGGIGTPQYAAPEQVKTGYADERSDIWSLGVMIHEMFFDGRPSFNESGQLLQWPTFSETPEGFRAVICKMLAPAPESRYQSVEEFLLDFRALVQRGEIRTVTKWTVFVGKLAQAAMYGAAIYLGAVALGGVARAR